MVKTFLELHLENKDLYFRENIDICLEHFFQICKLNTSVSNIDISKIPNLMYNIYSHLFNYAYCPTYQKILDVILFNLTSDTVILKTNSINPNKSTRSTKSINPNKSLKSTKSINLVKLDSYELDINTKKLYVPVFLHDDKLISLMILLYIGFRLNANTDKIISEANSILDEMIGTNIILSDTKNYLHISRRQYMEYIYIIYMCLIEMFHHINNHHFNSFKKKKLSQFNL
jgi:hypothetical protein